MCFEIECYVLSRTVGGDWGMLSLFALQSLLGWWYVLSEKIEDMLLSHV